VLNRDAGQVLEGLEIRLHRVGIRVLVEQHLDGGAIVPLPVEIAGHVGGSAVLGARRRPAAKSGHGQRACAETGLHGATTRETTAAE
jgi:hypothetical protein